MDFRVQGELQITMYNYIKKLIDSLPEDMIGTAQNIYLGLTRNLSAKLSKDME